MTDLEQAIAKGAALREDMEQFFVEHLADLTERGARVKAPDGRDVTGEAVEETKQTLARLRVN